MQHSRSKLCSGLWTLDSRLDTMERACSPALRLLRNPTTTQLPAAGSRNNGRRRSFAVHAQPPTDDDYLVESPKKVQVTQVNIEYGRNIVDCVLKIWMASSWSSHHLLLIIQSLKSSRRRGTGARQSLVSVGTSRGGGDQWSSDFDLTLRQLRLDDLVEDGQSDADVLVHLLVQQHTQFGMSIKGRVVTSFRKICDSCSNPYCTKIDEHFNITVLSSSRKDQSGMPELGDSDPSVIYVKPGTEIDIDSAIQETIRLTASAKSSCSEACEKSTVVWKYDGTGNQKKSYSQRWSKLLDLKKTLDKAAN